MGKVTVDMSMSLDGFIAGPNDSAENPLGDGGERLHDWMYGLEDFRASHLPGPWRATSPSEAAQRPMGGKG